MPLPTPMLDDRRFQDLVDHAKRSIPHYCPEWTDHNVSDPGVTLIELFAWMTDLLLYRVNQVPKKVYIALLDLLGVRLAPPRAASVPITFYLSAPQPVDVTIPMETEVATVRTETSPAIIFTTEADLTIRPASLLGAFTGSTRRGGGWIAHDLRQLALPERHISIFANPPSPGDAFYLALEQDHSNHVLAFNVGCEVAGGAGVDPTNPPIEWQVWSGGTARWSACTVEYDGTGGFNRSGEIILHLPTMARQELHDTNAYWLRCRLKDVELGQASYKVSPDLEHIQIESRGGTVVARHAITVQNEVVGRSDGTPGQSFRLLRTPLLARDPERDYLIVEPPGGAAERWQEVTDFADSQPDAHHYTLDSIDGTLMLGPSLIQPDATVYRFSAVPPSGSVLRFSRYQHGGGVIGNLPRGMLTVLKTSIPYVARVDNRAPAQGGLDAQSLEDAIVRAPQLLRTRTRAVTADDYEYLATQVPLVARACCIAPEAQPGSDHDPVPGHITVVVLPHVDAPQRRLPPDQLTLSAELRAAVEAHLSERSLVGTRLEVRAPQLVWISVDVRLRVAERGNMIPPDEVQRYAEAMLYRYLNPYVGGPQGDGWAFGRDVHVSEIYGLLQRVPGVEFVENVQINVSDLGSGAEPQPVASRLQLSKFAVVCSDQHQVSVM